MTEPGSKCVQIFAASAHELFSPKTKSCILDTASHSTTYYAELFSVDALVRSEG